MSLIFRYKSSQLAWLTEAHLQVNFFQESVGKHGDFESQIELSFQDKSKTWGKNMHSKAAYTTKALQSFDWLKYKWFLIPLFR